MSTLRSRRVFIRDAALILAGFGTTPHWLTRVVAAPSGRRKILVAIFQRGAADGLNIVVPYTDERYYQLRPIIGVPRPGAPNGVIDLDGQFGFHPFMQPLKPFWDNGQFAVIHAAGSPDPTRSHFDAQEFMESGTPGLKPGTGWLNRALIPAGPETSPVRAIATGPQLPRTLQGSRSAITVNQIQQFQVSHPGAAPILESMYAEAADGALGNTGRETFAAIQMLQKLAREPYVPSNGARYATGGELGRSLQEIARLIKADAGVEAAFAEIGSWDHHGNEPAGLSTVLRQFAGGLSAFCADMGDRMEDIVLVSMSEFGRTAKENGNSGTDHGHGGVMMVMGGTVRGGKVYGEWPGLGPEQLYEGRDLAVTTDFRDVLGELVMHHMGQTNVSEVFPGHSEVKPLGLLRG